MIVGSSIVLFEIPEPDVVMVDPDRYASIDQQANRQSVYLQLRAQIEHSKPVVMRIMEFVQRFHFYFVVNLYPTEPVWVLAV